MDSRVTSTRMGSNIVNTVLVDTDILIDVALETQEAIDRLTELEKDTALSVSVITAMELIVGCRNKTELRNTERFLQRFQVHPIIEQISTTAFRLIREYRLSHGLLIPDALIAATALGLDCELLTKNHRDFRFIKGLQLIPYPQAKP